MPLTLNVGLSRKLGLPDYGSLGASCNVQVELESSLLQNDLETFHRHVKNAYVACAQAVNDELARQQHPPQGRQADGHTPSPSAAGNGHSRVNGNGAGAARPRTGRKATASQLRAINSIADRQGMDLTQLLRTQYGVDELSDLSISDASNLIDSLKSATNGAGGKA